jgi:GNAT superfamily N-acetyltransferase
MDRDIAVHKASHDEIDQVTSIVTLAFANDPLWSRALARADGRVAHHFDFWRIFIEGALMNSWTWLTAGGEATSVWIPPGGSEMTTEQELRLDALARDQIGAGADSCLELLGRFEAVHPRSEPHFYLSLLATNPVHRGGGFGMSLLAHDLVLIDSQHLPAYLESSNPANDQRYGRCGFEKVGEVSYPGEKLSAATMWRAAR